MYKKEAIEILRKSSHDLGFLATANSEENYGRVWSRDSAITALAVCLHEVSELYPVIKRSILTLASHQKENGLIPSNVGVSSSGDALVSYGTLVGRVDAQTWWIIQTCLYLNIDHDEELKHQLKPQLLKTLNLLTAWEFNARSLIYTPLGGNWADEYIISGYTLYDNLLRYLALHLFLQIWPEETNFQSQKIEVLNAIRHNFTKETNSNNSAVHTRAKSIWNQKQLGFFPAAFDSARYSTYWDAAANGLALLCGFKSADVVSTVQQFINDYPQGYRNNITDTHKTFEEMDPDVTGFIPAFWPVIEPSQPDWILLEQQYNYQFKNQPYHFHNGGSWPVMTGILGLGLTSQNHPQITQKLRQNYEQFLRVRDNMQFSEYISMDNCKPGGKKELCFSASGYLFLCATEKQIHNIFNL